MCRMRFAIYHKAPEKPTSKYVEYLQSTQNAKLLVIQSLCEHHPFPVRVPFPCFSANRLAHKLDEGLLLLTIHDGNVTLGVFFHTFYNKWIIWSRIFCRTLVLKFSVLNFALVVSLILVGIGCSKGVYTYIRMCTLVGLLLAVSLDMASFTTPP